MAKTIKVDPVVARLRARKAARARWAKEDPRPAMEKVREGFRDKLREDVRDEARRRGEHLSEDEVTRRAESKRRAHLDGMSLRSKTLRASRKAA
jgi:hypothetical protein